MPKIQADQIEVGAGPEHTLPKYGPGPGWEFVASRVTDDGAIITLPGQVVDAGDLSLENNGTRFRLNDVSKSFEVDVNKNDPEHGSTLALNGSPGIAVLQAVDGSNVAELSLAPMALAVELGFNSRIGALDLTAATISLLSDSTNIGVGAGSTTAIAGKLTNNGIQVGVASSVQHLAQTASIALTDILINGLELAPGLYRLSYYLVTTTAGTSGDVKATFSWRDEGAVRSVDSATVTFGTLAAPASGVLIMQISVVDPFIQYSTTVTSPVGDPQYALFITLERLL